MMCRTDQLERGAPVITCTACGYPNPPDADFCVNPSLPDGRGPCGEYLGWAKRDAAGAPAPERPAAAPVGRPIGEAGVGPPEPAVADPAGRVDVSASLVPAQLRVEPGGEVTCEIRVRNQGSVVDRFQLELRGRPEQWSLVEPATLSLFPGTESSAVIRFRPPRSSRVPAGPARFRVRAASSTQPAVFALVEGIVEVGPYSALEAQIMPQTSGGAHHAEHRVIIDNQGNAQVRVVLEASDPDGVLDLRVDPPVLTVEPGASAMAAVGVVARRPLTGGAPQPRPFSVQVHVPAGQELTLPALFVQEPPPPPPPPPQPVMAPQRGPAPGAGPASPAKKGLGAGGCLVMGLLVPLMLIGGLIFGLLAWELVTEGGSYWNGTYLAWTVGFLLFTLLVMMAIRWVWKRRKSG